MNFVVAVTTYNPLSTLRMNLLEQTMDSLTATFVADRKWLFDNGSTDGSEQILRGMAQKRGWGLWRYDAEDGNHTPGRGRNEIMSRVKRTDVVVFSDDDMLWRDESREKLEELWSNIPPEVMIVSGLLEPEWHWNLPREAIDCGGERILVRDSCPGAAWTFTWDNWKGIIAPVIDDFGYDYKKCCELMEGSLKVAQIDLAEHIGWGASTHGNEAIRTGKPLDKDKWRM